MRCPCARDWPSMARLLNRADDSHHEPIRFPGKMTMNKNENRLRRAKSTRSHIRKLAVARLSVHRTGQHLYAQVFDASGQNVAAAAAVGKAVAERALAAGIESVAFDRSGFRYHGRVKALAEAAREAGLKF